MIEPTDATMIDSRDAYPIDECVAKMLGWMHGSERLYTVILDEFGFPPEKLPHIYSLYDSLDTHLDQLRERARSQYIIVAEAYADAVDGTPEKDALEGELEQKESFVEECSELIRKAYYFKSEINKELAKGEQSQLHIDNTKKDNSQADIIYIKLESLDDWAKKYGVNIIDVPETILNAKSMTHQYAAETLTTSANKPNKSQRDNALSIVLNDILIKDPQAKTTKVIAKLRELVGTKNAVINEVLDEGVKWLDHNNKIQITNKASLGERIRYWRKHRLKQD